MLGKLRFFTCFFLVAEGISALAQTGDLAEQFLILKQLDPNATRIGLLYHPERSGSAFEQEILKATQDSGLLIIKSPVRSVRDVAKAVRALDPYEVDMVYMAEDRIVTGVSAIKFVVKYTVKKRIPVLTADEKAFQGGAYGLFFKSGARWILKINGKVQGRFDLQIPENNDRFTIEE